MKNATYVNPGFINGICVPLAIQTVFIKQYCEHIKESLPLPSSEVGLIAEYPTLTKLLKGDFNNIFYATHLLIPRGFITKKKLNSATNHHFILEKVSVPGVDLKDFLNKRDFIDELSNAKPLDHILKLATKG